MQWVYHLKVLLQTQGKLSRDTICKGISEAAPEANLLAQIHEDPVGQYNRFEKTQA